MTFSRSYSECMNISWMAGAQLHVCSRHLISIPPSLACNAGDTEGAMIHSPKHCYPGSGWSSLSSEIIKIKVPDSNNTIEINEYILSKGDTRQLVYLRDMGIEVQSEVPLPVFYRGQEINEAGFRLDLLAGNRLVVELKSVETVQPVHKKRLLTYLRLADKPLGLLINFNEPMLKDGITRIINALPKT